MDKETFTLREASRELGAKTYDLRRFCNKGLIRGVRHQRNGYRILNRTQVERARLLENLRKIGFTFADMKAFVKLEEAGDETILERKAMLETKKRRLWQQVEELQKGIDFVERKVEIYDQILEGHKS